MIEKVVINNRHRTPISYLKDLSAFGNGAEFVFKPGVNVIVGKNGCGKTTLMKLIETYLMVGQKECDRGIYNSGINKLYGPLSSKFKDGADVYADYVKNVFRLCHENESSNDTVLKDFNSFGTYYTQKHSSTGEAVNVALVSMFKYMFSERAKLTFDYEQFKESHPDYYEYIQKHKIDTDDEYTILMDEPDRNLDVDNVKQIKGILSVHKPQTQIIAVVHNPLLIYHLSKNPEVNMIEMTEGYVDSVKKMVDMLVKNQPKKKTK